MAGYLRLALCINNSPCMSSLGRPSPFYSIFLEKSPFYSLPSLFAGASAEQRAHSQNTRLLEASFMVFHSMPYKSCKVQSMHSGQEKDTDA